MISHNLTEQHKTNIMLLDYKFYSSCRVLCNIDLNTLESLLPLSKAPFVLVGCIWLNNMQRCLNVDPLLLPTQCTVLFTRQKWNEMLFCIVKGCKTYSRLCDYPMSPGPCGLFCNTLHLCHVGAPASPLSPWDQLHRKGHQGPPGLWLRLWEGGPPQVCGRQDRPVGRYHSARAVFKLF